jgi:hypothetical protein
MTVRDYFEIAFHDYLGCHSDQSVRDALSSMPLDSTCGDDCKAAIDAGAVLQYHVRRGYGDDRPELIYPIAQAVADTCCVFICG